jgi:hypothetical protein
MQMIGYGGLPSRRVQEWLVRIEETTGRIDLTPQGLRIEQKELAFMTSLAPLLGDSPRAVKRFINLYRLAKTGLGPEDSAGFLEDGASSGYRSLMLVLALMTGMPATAAAIFRRVVDPSWKDTTLKELSEGQMDGAVPGDQSRLGAWLGQTENKALQSLTAEQLQTVIERVSRYSFYAGPQASRVG